LDLVGLLLYGGLHNEVHGWKKYYISSSMKKVLISLQAAKVSSNSKV